MKTPYSEATEEIQLEFINTFNMGGPNLQPTKFKSISEAKQRLSAPFFWKLYNKLTVHEMGRILDVINKVK